MRMIEECINDLLHDIENFIGGNITERQNELLNEILEIHKEEKRQSLDSCKDVISRMAALETLKNLYHTLSGGAPEYPEVTINRALGRIKILPSVSRARPKGKWLATDEKYPDDWHCSCCGAIVEADEQDYHNWNYCYNCGADMRESEVMK